MNWLAIIGTISGAIVGSSIAFIAQIIGMHNARIMQLNSHAEDRAKWAAEKKIDGLKLLHRLVGEAIECTELFRIHSARNESDSQSDNYNTLREKWEYSIMKLYEETDLLDRGLHESLIVSMKPRNGWLVSKTHEDSLHELLKLEQNLDQFRRLIADTHRNCILARVNGKDI